MKLLFTCLIAAQTLATHAAEAPPAPGHPVPIFDGKTLHGWEGTAKWWRVEDGCLTGGSFTETVPDNEFLATTRNYTNFVVRLKIKLTGTNGFINSGFQIRSQRVPKSTEMAGYQCDFGEPNWYGAVYDESRRNKVMAWSDMTALDPVIKRQDWNDYVIRADGARITTWINGVLGTDYIEPDDAIIGWGRMGIQVHGGGKAVVQVKDITIEELPEAAPGKKFVPAANPGKASKASPLTPDEERASFTLPPGFEIELVESESEGLGKFVAVDWDLQGRLWTMTALEYPVDGNENPAAAKELYASKAKDKVLVFDRDPNSPNGYSTQPHVFAEGLAIPLGILPYKNGVYVQHGTEIVFLSDNDGDGKADKRDVILSGFGVQDSHLFPHQFTRAPGNWLWMAQGAFNYGKVRDASGKEIQFDQTRMSRFRANGADFEITSQGPCNIWGLAMNAEGETWIQEANDYGYPTIPFHTYANYPGCSDAQMKSYAPEFPGTAPDFQMGGTGLSGLALSDKGVWPEAYADVMYVANPITRKIQAIKIHRDGPRYKLQKLGDFVQSSDEWFRPVAMRLGPDGCLYIVDWYNKIISHNEVPRNHPERDKKRGRIWRVKHQGVVPAAIPDFSKLSGDELVNRLGVAPTTASHLAWQAITDRQLLTTVPRLKSFVSDTQSTPAKRISSLWALEGLNSVDRDSLIPLFIDPSRNVRREAVRAYAEARLSNVDDIVRLADDVDPEVRSEVIHSAATMLASFKAKSASDPSIGKCVALIIRMARPALASPTAPSTQNGSKMIKVREAYEREFERYVARYLMEQHPAEVAAYLDSPEAASLPVENRLVATLALEPKASARRVALLLPKLERAPGQEEILRLAQFPEEAGTEDALKSALNNPATRRGVLEALLAVRNRIEAEKWSPLIVNATKSLFSGSDEETALGLRLASGFKVTALEPQLSAMLQTAQTPKVQIAALKALGEIGSSEVAVFSKLAQTSTQAAVRAEALNALSASKSDQALPALVALWADLTGTQRRMALGKLTQTKASAKAVAASLKEGKIAVGDLDDASTERLLALLDGEPDARELLDQLRASFKPVLQLNGQEDDFAETGVTLDGAFTVETWVRLQPGIDNRDGIFAVPDQIDINFYDSRLRVYGGSSIGDVIVAKKPMSPKSWTHYAITRDAKGSFKIYMDGELSSNESKSAPQKLENVRIGWTIPQGGTQGALSEYRIWNYERKPEDIRNQFDRSLADQAKPEGLVFYAPGAGPWGKLHGSARIAGTSEPAPLLTAAESKAVDQKFAQFRTLANRPGNVAHGREAAAICLTCHTISGQGGNIGPNLSGAGAMGTEGLLRNIITPNAAMEAGYRTYRAEMKNGDMRDGFFVREDADVVILRTAGAEDQRISKLEIRSAKFLRRSLMPEGLLESMTPEQVSDLFAYLTSLK